MCKASCRVAECLRFSENLFTTAILSSIDLSEVDRCSLSSSAHFGVTPVRSLPSYAMYSTSRCCIIAYDSDRVLLIRI